MTQTRRGPEKGRRVTADYGVRYWLTAKAYRALGETPPPPWSWRPTGISVWNQLLMSSTVHRGQQARDRAFRQASPRSTPLAGGPPRHTCPLCSPCRRHSGTGGLRHAPPSTPRPPGRHRPHGSLSVWLSTAGADLGGLRLADRSDAPLAGRSGACDHHDHVDDGADHGRAKATGEGTYEACQPLSAGFGRVRWGSAAVLGDEPRVTRQPQRLQPDRMQWSRVLRQVAMRPSHVQRTRHRGAAGRRSTCVMGQRPRLQQLGRLLTHAATP